MKISKNISVLFLATLFCFTLSCKEQKSEPEIITVSTKTQKEPKVFAGNLSKAEFTIKGMTCQIGCAATIEKKLAKMEGVKSAKVDFEKELALVEFDEKTLSLDDISSTVTAVNGGEAYKVQGMKKLD